MSAGASTVEGIVTNSRKAYLAHPEGVESEAANGRKCSSRRLLVSGDRQSAPVLRSFRATKPQQS